MAESGHPNAVDNSDINIQVRFSLLACIPRWLTASVGLYALDSVGSTEHGLQEVYCPRNTVRSITQNGFDDVKMID